MLTESTHKHPNIVTRRRWTTIYCRQQLLLKPLFQNDLGKVLATRPQPGVVREVPNEEISRKLRKQAGRLKLRQFPLPLPTFFGGSPKSGPGIFGLVFWRVSPLRPGVSSRRSGGWKESGHGACRKGERRIRKNPEGSSRTRQDDQGWPGRRTADGLPPSSNHPSGRNPGVGKDCGAEVPGEPE